MNILDKIIAHKLKEVAIAKTVQSIGQLEKTPFFGSDTYSLCHALTGKNATGIIAEFKRKSPSKGLFHDNIQASAITEAYTKYGATGLSILTDASFFGGNNKDLIDSRANKIPILRKEFIVDPYQIIEAKSIGADVILLIAACLTRQQVVEYSKLAQSLQMEVLLEIHTPDELAHICDSIDMVGVNNRNLKDFTVDINRSLELYHQIPSGMIAISESGISEQSILTLKAAGFKGFLMGERFMRTNDPAKSFRDFIHPFNLNYEN